MRFLVDECTGPTVTHWLASAGHEVYCVSKNARGSSDGAILEKAAAEDWIIVSNDKDFGEKIFRDAHSHRGVVLLRLNDDSPANAIETLRRLLDQYGPQLPNRFTVVTESRVRITGKQP